MRFAPESSTIRKRPSKRTERLAKLAPSDTQILFDLARLYETKGDLDRARDTFKRVLDLDPKYVAALIAIGQVGIRRRDFDQALNYLNPAYSAAVQTGNESAKGAALHAIGVAFKRLNSPRTRRATTNRPSSSAGIWATAAALRPRSRSWARRRRCSSRSTRLS